MLQAVRGSWRMWPSMLIGAIVGMLAAPFGLWAYSVALQQYDASHPVVLSRLTVIAATADHIDVRLVTTRVRACRYLPPPTVLARQVDGTEETSCSTPSAWTRHPAAQATPWARQSAASGGCGRRPAPNR
jgi:hypothetical protein